MSALCVRRVARRQRFEAIRSKSWASRYAGARRVANSEPAGRLFRRHFVCNDNICVRCAKESKFEQCSVCTQRLSRDMFPDSQFRHQSRSSILRCSACHRCDSCKEVLPAIAFRGASAACVTCSKRYACSVCSEELRKDSFAASLFAHQTRNPTLVCRACGEKGYSVMDLTDYWCQSCGRRGHLKFDRQKLWNAKYRDGPKQLAVS